MVHFRLCPAPRSRLAASVTSFGANAKAAGVAGTAGAAGSAGGVAKEAKEAESGKAKENVPSVLRERSGKRSTGAEELGESLQPEALFYMWGKYEGFGLGILCLVNPESLAKGLVLACSAPSF